jgi:hypothetical protein
VVCCGQRIKVFWFFSSEKNKDSSFSEEKEAKRLFSVRGTGQEGGWLAFAGRSGHC